MGRRRYRPRFQHRVPQRDRARTRRRRRRRRVHATNVEDIYAAGDLTQFYDTILDSQAQNGAWGSAKEQGSVAATNMVADAEEKEFRWVSSYSITHFDFPFLSFGHPTLATTKPTEVLRQRVTAARLRGRKLVGGVLIGDLSQQSAFKQLIREERRLPTRRTY